MLASDLTDVYHQRHNVRLYVGCLFGEPDWNSGKDNVYIACRKYSTEYSQENGGEVVCVLSYQLSAGVGAKKRDFPGPPQNPPFFSNDSISDLHQFIIPHFDHFPI